MYVIGKNNVPTVLTVTTVARCYSDDASSLNSCSECLHDIYKSYEATDMSEHV